MTTYGLIKSNYFILLIYFHRPSAKYFGNTFPNIENENLNKDMTPLMDPCRPDRTLYREINGNRCIGGEICGEGESGVDVRRVRVVKGSAKGGIMSDHKFVVTTLSIASNADN